VQRTLATSADGELVLKLYELRTEAVMRQARAWLTGEFWPTSADEFFTVVHDSGSPKNAWLRQVISYWEMASSLVLHGSLSADLFVDCNPEPFFILAKFDPLLPAIHEKMPTWFSKTLQLIDNSPTAAARYEAMKKNVEGMRAARAAQ
jgi:hypothetical protein